METHTTVPITDDDLLLCRLAVSADSFSMDWAHCDQLSNYLARVVGFDRADTFIFSNLLSTVLNEILEAIFLNHANDGSIVLSLYQSGEDTVIISDIPVDEEANAFYVTTASDIEKGDASEMYRREMIKEKEVSRAIGFYELAADYGARIGVKEQFESGVLRLCVSVQLDRFVEGYLE